MNTSPAFSAPAALSVTSFAPPHRAVTSLPTPPAARVRMGAALNVARKKAKVAAAKEQMESSEMIFAAPLEGLSMSDIKKLKELLPETTSVATVKNSLMRLAIQETRWECLGDLTNASNMWFFVKADLKGTVKAYEKFVKELKREPLKGGAYEGEVYDTEGITEIAALPDKQELMRRVGASLRMMPTKFGRSINMVPTKLARAVKLAVADEPEGDAE